MQQEQQQQQASPRQVIVIQQPVMVNSRRGVPFLGRGVKFDNGCRCPGHIFITVGFVGFGFIYMSVPFISTDEDEIGFGVYMMIAGVVMAITCCRLCCRARRDYNALPPDHPDRAEYSGIVTLPQQPTTATYQLPPGAQIAGYPSASFVEQAVGYPAASSGGQAVGYPAASSGGQVVGYPPSPAGQTRSVTPSAPIASAGYNTDDPPPSYEEIIENAPRYT